MLCGGASALAITPSPGAIAPPCHTPSLVTRSTVMAVPHETTRPGPTGRHQPKRGQNTEGAIGTADLGSLNVHGNRNLGGGLKPRQLTDLPGLEELGELRCQREG